MALVLLVVGCAPADSGPPSAATDVCTVARLSDGDSLACEEGGERVRLLLIDAPEAAQRPWGDSARAALARLMPRGRQVRLEYDVRRRDDFGRLLAYAWLEDGRMVNEEMARTGYVVLLSYPPNVQHVDRVRAAIEDARDSARGLWAGPAFDCRPVDFRAGRCGGREPR